MTKKLKSPSRMHFTWIALFIALSCHAQNTPLVDAKNNDSTYAFINFSTALSSAKTPFWLRSNQFGVVPLPGSFTAVRIGSQYYRPIDRNNKKGHWQMGGGVDVVANFCPGTKLILPQIHLSVRYKNWEFFAGRKAQWVGLADSSMGTGSYAWSTNAMPIPKIQVGTKGFVAVPFTNRWLNFNAFYSEGLFERDRAVTSKLKLHQKIFYIRIGRISSRLKLYGGFNHQVQWGGRSPYQTVNGRMPHGLRNYIHVITGKPGDASEVVNEFDNGNRVGNHLGTIDLAMEIETFGSSWFFYRQNVYEDGSLYALTNIADGLNGIRMRRKNSYGANFEVTEVVVEFLNTKSQGGPEFNIEKAAAKRGDLGRDNYFNNAQIRDGWSYQNMTIGTPFITPSTDTEWNRPKYGNFFTSNNRVSVLHVGMSGSIFQQILWFTKLSYSNNIGTYDLPFARPATQFSGLFSAQIKVNIWGEAAVGASIAVDRGALYQNTASVVLSVKKSLLKKPKPNSVRQRP